MFERVGVDVIHGEIFSSPPSQANKQLHMGKVLIWVAGERSRTRVGKLFDSCPTRGSKIKERGQEHLDRVFKSDILKPGCPIPRGRVSWFYL